MSKVHVSALWTPFYLCWELFLLGKTRTPRRLIQRRRMQRLSIWGGCTSRESRLTCIIPRQYKSLLYLYSFLFTLFRSARANAFISLRNWKDRKLFKICENTNNISNLSPKSLHASFCFSILGILKGLFCFGFLGPVWNLEGADANSRSPASTQLTRRWLISIKPKRERIPC